MKKSIKLNLVLTASMLVLSLVALSLMGNSKAWFSKNEKVEGFGISVSSDLPTQLDVTVKSYGVIEINDSGTVFTLEKKDGSGTRPEVYALPLEDPNNISYSQYKKALVVLVEVTAAEQVTVDMLLRTEQDSVSIAPENYFSNCMQISDATLNDTAGTATRVADSTRAFVSVENGICSKETRLMLAENLALSKNTPTTLCFVMEYNAEFIEYANHTILTNALDYFELNYQNDLIVSIY